MASDQDRLAKNYDLTYFASASEYVRRWYQPSKMEEIKAKYPEQAAAMERLMVERQAELEAKEQPGDRWAEWRHYLHPLSGSGGPALVRGDVIVWLKTEWVS